MPTWYREHRPSVDLDDELACTWQANVGGEPHSLIPDACLDVVWIDDGSVWLCGPETSGWSFSLPPGTTAVGVRFRPAVAPPVLGLDAREVLNSRIRLDGLWGDRVVRSLSGRVGDAPSPADRVNVLEHAVRERAADAPPVDVVAAEVAARVAAPEPARVSDLARDIGLSERQLHRRCAAAFGYGPAVLGRILRLQRFLALAKTSGSAAGLAQLALMAGYADQPHLSREVRTIAKTTPTALLAS